MLLTSFPPVIAPGAKALILGSMPGAASLALQQYYGHPRNLFWPIMGELVGAYPTLPYAERLAALQSAGIALWDVLKHCERPGSLDASIVAGSEAPNDFPSLLSQYATIRAICFNGKKAEQTFQRHVLPLLPAAVTARIELIALPSTSPANAYQSFEQKLARWQVVADIVRE
jgi:double-stranded uracil-DNA glycosylase